MEPLQDKIDGVVVSSELVPGKEPRANATTPPGDPQCQGSPAVEVEDTCDGTPKDSTCRYRVPTPLIAVIDPLAACTELPVVSRWRIVDRPRQVGPPTIGRHHQKSSQTGTFSSSPPAQCCSPTTPLLLHLRPTSCAVACNILLCFAPVSLRKVSWTISHNEGRGESCP